MACGMPDGQVGPRFRWGRNEGKPCAANGRYVNRSPSLAPSLFLLPAWGLGIRLIRRIGYGFLLSRFEGEQGVPAHECSAAQGGVAPGRAPGHRDGPRCSRSPRAEAHVTRAQELELHATSSPGPSLLTQPVRMRCHEPAVLDVESPLGPGSLPFHRESPDAFSANRCVSNPAS